MSARLVLYLNFNNHQDICRENNLSIEHFGYIITPFKITCTAMHAKSLQSCPTLCHPMSCSLPGSSVYGNSSGKNIGVGCMPSSRGSPQPRDQTCVSYVSCIGRQVNYHQSHLGNTIYLNRYKIQQNIYTKRTNKSLNLFYKEAKEKKQLLRELSLSRYRVITHTHRHIQTHTDTSTHTQMIPQLGWLDLEFFDFMIG